MLETDYENTTPLNTVKKNSVTRINLTIKKESYSYYNNHSHGSLSYDISDLFLMKYELIL